MRCKNQFTFEFCIYNTFLFYCDIGLCQLKVQPKYFVFSHKMDKYDEILTAKSWIIMNFKTGSYMRGSNFQEKRQIASLTKMYTLYACLKVNQLLNINPEKTFIKVIDICTTGTTAGLQSDKYIRLKDLYYGMMLPSGNDAASLLSYYYGFWLDKESSFPNLIFSKHRKVDLKDRIKHCNLFVKRFMQFINQIIIKGQLNHKKTKLQNPHGLGNKFQISTAWQLAQASIHFMKNSKVNFVALTQQFRKIVKTQKYSGHYLSEDQADQNGRGNYFQWENTNLLLRQQGYGGNCITIIQGVKTGQTTAAGSCLASYKSVMIKNKLPYQFLVVVLGCATAEKRFSQSKILCLDLQKHLEQILY